MIAVSSDILNVGRPAWLIEKLHHARIVGTAHYRSPAFGWLREEKKAVLIRLGEDDGLSVEDMNDVVTSFALTEEEYKGKDIAFMVENGEKEYSFEVAGVRGGKVDVLWRYTVGGSESVRKVFEPELMGVEMKE